MPILSQPIVGAVEDIGGSRFRDTTLEEELERIKDEKKSLQNALEEALAAVVAERRSAADYIGRFEEVVFAKDAMERSFHHFLRILTLTVEFFRQLTAIKFEMASYDSKVYQCSTLLHIHCPHFLPGVFFRLHSNN